MIIVEHRRRGDKVVRHLHRKCLSELGRLMRKEHQSSQFRGHFPQFNTPNPTQFIGGSRLNRTADQFAAENPE
jgi:hypothetical protein